MFSNIFVYMEGKQKEKLEGEYVQAFVSVKWSLTII